MHLTASRDPVEKLPGRFTKKLLLAMKLTAILLTVACISAAAAGHSQLVTLNLKDAPLQKVFTEIRKQTGFNFLFSSKELKQAGTVTVQVTNASVDEVMSRCFANKPFVYTIENNTIVVKQKVINMDQQGPPASTSIDVRGRVVDENGNPVEGVTVTIKGTKRATATNVNGEFEFKLIYENSVLVFTAVMIETREMSVQGRQYLPVAVITKVTGMGEVIVNKGYYTEKQRLSTGNVSTVTAKDIEKQPVNNPLQALQGRVPGLFITQQTGLPGGGFDVLIRGKNSLINGNDPLYIIDGVPYPSQSVPSIASIVTYLSIGLNTPSPLNYINPYDIESIDVLKDADATAIYGTRGANGVILITTKKGKPGTTNVEVNVYRGSGNVAHMVKMLNNEQFVQYRTEAFANDGTNPGSLDYDVNGTWDRNRYTDWQHLLLGGRAQFTDAEASVSGGSAAVQYTLNGGYHKETTVFPGDFGTTKGDFHFNVNGISPDQKFKVQLSGSYTASQNRLIYSDLINESKAYPTAPKIYDSLGNLNWANSTWNNPFARLVVSSKVFAKNLVAQNVLSYEIIPGLEVKSSLGYSYFQLNDLEAYPTTFYRPSLNRTTGNTDFSFNNIRTWIAEPQVNYTRAIWKGNLSATAGYTLQNNSSDGYILNATGYPDNSLLESLAAASAVAKGNVLNIKYKYNAGFARLNYTLKERYILNLTARRDGSSRFGPGKQFNSFASAAGSWIFSDESFIQRAIPFLSFGKLRMSYGTTGSDQVGDYRFLDIYSFVSWGTPYQGTSGLYPANLFNPDLAWEINRKIEAAAEIGLWKDRLFVSASYFRNRSSNQLVSTPLPAVTGFTGISTNLPATVQNKGWEFVVRTVNVKSKRFSWISSFNLTSQKNKLIEFPGLETSTYVNQFVVGQSISVLKLYDNIGVNPQTGLYSFRAADGSETSNPNFATDKTVLWAPEPKYFGGFQNTLSYRNFDLDFFFQFVKQLAPNPLLWNSIQPGIFSRLSNFNWPAAILDNHWQKPGDKAIIQKYSTQVGDAFTAYSAAQQSDFGYVNGSYIRLKNVFVSYRLSPELLKKMHLKKLRIYLQGQNILTITEYKGTDPENQGKSVPPLRVWTGGIQLGL